MSKIIDRTGKGSAITQAEFDANYDSLHGINQVVAGTSFTVDITDQGDTLEFTSGSAVAVTLDAIATIQAAAHTSDFRVTLIATGAGTVTITPDAADAINTGAATIVLTTDEYVTIQTDSTGAIWNIINSPILGLTSTLAELNITDGDTADSSVTVADADQIIVNDAGTMKQTAVTDLDTYLSQTTKTLTNKTIGSGFGGGTIVTHTSSPFSASSGTQINVTGIPSWVKRINITLNSVSASAADGLAFIIGDSGGLEATGYFRAQSYIGSDSSADTLVGASTTYWFAGQSSADADILSGIIRIELVDSSNNTWAQNAQIAVSSAGTDYTYFLSGSKSLSDTLTQLRLYWASASSFDGGVVGVTYEG